MKEIGRIYIVTNPAFPHLFKIGMTSKDSTEKRGLNASNIPEDFVVMREYACNDPAKLEKLFHKTFDGFRHYTATGRETEFFYIGCYKNALEWVDTLKNLGVTVSDVTAEAKAEEEAIRETDKYDETKVIEAKIRSKTTFAMVHIPIGSTLALDIDGKATVKTVDARNTVELQNGEKMSLSAAANKLMRERGRSWQGVAGTWHFMYKGERIWEIRLRMEKEGQI